jgi:hypothetical protein
MSDLKQIAVELSKRKISRKQFLVLIGGNILGMISIFRILQDLNTPEMVKTDNGTFGEHEYGHPDPIEVAKVKAKSFSQDVFG